MAALYRATCSHCHLASAAIADTWRAVRLRSGVIEALPHPFEEGRLQQLGFTWDEAAREHRFLTYAAVVCASCASTADIDAHHPMPTFAATWQQRLQTAVFLLVLAAALAAVLVGYGQIGLGWRLLMIPGVLVVALYVYVSSVAPRLPDRLNHTRPLPPSTLRCDRCNAGCLYPVGVIAERPLRCPQCGVPAYTFHAAGIS